MEQREALRVKGKPHSKVLQLSQPLSQKLVMPLTRKRTVHIAQINSNHGFFPNWLNNGPQLTPIAKLSGNSVQSALGDMRCLFKGWNVGHHSTRHNELVASYAAKLSQNRLHVLLSFRLSTPSSTFAGFTRLNLQGGERGAFPRCWGLRCLCGVAFSGHLFGHMGV